MSDGGPYSFGPSRSAEGSADSRRSPDTWVGEELAPYLPDPYRKVVDVQAFNIITILWSHTPQT